VDPPACRSFAANAVRLQLHALAYNLANFMRTLAMPRTTEPWSLTSLSEKLIKIGAKVVSHGRYVTFQMAEAAVQRQMFQEILALIARLMARSSRLRVCLAMPTRNSSQIHWHQIDQPPAHDTINRRGRAAFDHRLQRRAMYSGLSAS
jgi:hypothetical protein